jgi:hypothetical protein
MNLPEKKQTRQNEEFETRVLLYPKREQSGKIAFLQHRTLPSKLQRRQKKLHLFCPRFDTSI